MTTEAEHLATPGDVAVAMARLISNLRPQDIGPLRKLDPLGGDYQDCPEFKEVTRPFDIDDTPDRMRRWALVVKGIALMTPDGSNRADYRTAHNGYMPVGRALFLGDQRERRGDNGLYGEWRLKLLLNARGDRERSLLSFMFRMMGNLTVTFNWREMANLIMADDEQEADRRRLRIAHGYHSAPYRN